MKKSTLLLSAFSAIILSGCAADEGHGPRPYVRIAPEIGSRVTGLHFDEGDRIGLRILRGAEAFAENHEMTYDGAAFAAPDLLWYDDLRERSTLQAYYPYDAAGMPAEFSVRADQRAGCVSSDLLAAVAHEVTPVAAPVRMLFRHLMSQLDVLVDNRSGSSVESVSLGGFGAEAEVDFEVPAARAKEGAAAVEILAQEVESDLRYRAVLVPQQGVLTVTVVTADGKSRSKSIPAAQLAGGKRYDLSVTVEKIDISVSLGGEIEEWGEGGSLGGGELPDDGDGTLEYAGASYRTTEIGGRRWMSENLRYVPAGATMSKGVWYPQAGEEAVAVQGLLYDYATATAGGGTRTAAPLRGICPEGWHLPSVEELALLTGAGADFFCGAGYVIVSPGGAADRYGESCAGYLMGSSLTDGKCDCLSLDGTGATLTTIRASYGISVRCVEDE